MTPKMDILSNFIIHEFIAASYLVLSILNRGEENLFIPITYAIASAIWATFAGYELGKMIWGKHDRT